MTRGLLTVLREAEARVLRRLMKVRAAQPVFTSDPEQWLKTQFGMETAQVAREYGLTAIGVRFEDDGESGGFYIHGSGAGETCVYGPVLWHVECGREFDVLARRGVGYVLRHTDLL